MRFRPPPGVWAMLVATLVNVIIFDLLVLRAENTGLPRIILAGGIGIAAGVATLYLIDQYSRR